MAGRLSVLSVGLAMSSTVIRSVSMRGMGGGQVVSADPAYPWVNTAGVVSSAFGW